MTKQTIICGDAIAEMQQMSSESIDLIIADPPYNLGKNYGNRQAAQDFEGYLDFSRQWLREARRLLSPRGTIYLFMGFRYIAYLYAILEQELALRFNSWIVWHYTQGMGKRRGFSPRHDDILMFTKGKDFIFNLDAVRVPQKYYRARNNMRGANPGDVWEFSHVHYCQANRQAHPTQKPEALLERMILASTDDDSTVLDPFLGSGTTLRVCQQLGRQAIGIEINADYVAMAQQRLAQPFAGFDSVDPRSKRVPNDLRDESIRAAYLENHKQWFLKNHQADLADFEEAVAEIYPKQP